MIDIEEYQQFVEQYNLWVARIHEYISLFIKQNTRFEDYYCADIGFYDEEIFIYMKPKYQTTIEECGEKCICVILDVNLILIEEEEDRLQIWHEYIEKHPYKEIK